MATKGALRPSVFASCFKDACEMLMSTILKELQKKNPACPEQALLSEGLHQSPATQDSGLRAGLIINGKTLEFALQESLQKQFLELTACCQAVVCCRATPLQKSEVVKLVRNHLQVMTLAIGEWGWNRPRAPHFHATLGADPSVPSFLLYFCLPFCLSVLSLPHFPSPFPLCFLPILHSFPSCLHHLFDHLLRTTW